MTIHTRLQKKSNSWNWILYINLYGILDTIFNIYYFDALFQIQIKT